MNNIVFIWKLVSHCKDFCYIECSIPVVDNMESAQKLKGCTVIKGELQIQIRSGGKWTSRSEAAQWSAGKVFWPLLTTKVQFPLKASWILGKCANPDFYIVSLLLSFISIAPNTFQHLTVAHLYRCVFVCVTFLHFRMLIGSYRFTLFRQICKICL